MNTSSKNSSPYRQVSELGSSLDDEVHESLDKYLNFPLHESHTDKLKREIILVEIESINSDLSNISK